MKQPFWNRIQEKLTQVSKIFKLYENINNNGIMFYKVVIK